MKKRILFILPVAVIAALIFMQLFFPQAAGLANNGDFGKVIARSHFVSADNNGADNFVYFVKDYRYDPSFQYEAGLKSTEQQIFWLSSTIARLFLGGRLDIRLHGFIHLSLICVGLFFGMRAILRLTPQLQIVISIWTVLVLGDIAYTAYINSFYMDAAALAGAILCLGTGADLALRRTSGMLSLIVFGLGFALLVGSKSQHAPLAAPLGIFCFLAAKAQASAKFRLLSGLMVLAGFAIAGFTLTSVPFDYPAKATFNTIFLKILPMSTDPAADLPSLGLSPDYLQYVGMHAFVAGGPCDDGVWLNAFARRTGPTEVAAFWVRNPTRFLRAVHGDIVNFLPELRPKNLSNVERSAGLPPGSKLPSWTGWSTVKAYVLERFPALIYFVLGGALLVGCRRWRRPSGVSSPHHLSTAILLVLAAACMELCISAGFDAIETNRHFLLFHLFFDILVLMLIAAGIRRSERPAIQPSLQK